MRARTIQVMLISVVALLMVIGTGVAQERTPTTVPFDEALSVYVAHDGTWFNYNADQDESAEIEDPLAVFEPEETISDDPDLWLDHQINLPPIPEGWLFFEPVETEPMDLVVLIRDTNNRLGHVEISDRDTGQPIGILQANPEGSEISGTVPVDPLIEAFNMEVKDATGATLMKPAPNHPQIVAAVAAVVSELGWVANCGDQHTPCPAEPRTEPYGNPLSLGGRKSDMPRPTRRACGGGNEFENDAADVNSVPPGYDLKVYEIVKDLLPDTPPGNLAQPAMAEVMAKMTAVRQPYLSDTKALEYLDMKPFSRGIGHWPMDVTGQIDSVIYAPYRLRVAHKGKAEEVLEIGLRNPNILEHGRNQDYTALPIALAVKGSLERTERQVLQEVVAVGEIWGLHTTARDEPDANPESNITGPVTIELWADRAAPDGEPGLIGGTGTTTRGAAFTTPSPPVPFTSPPKLTFPDTGEHQGQCEVQLGKGWNWQAAGDPAHPAYSNGTVAPFEVRGGETAQINVTLQGLLTLVVKTIDPEQDPCQAVLEVYRQVGEAMWYPVWLGQVTHLENGEYVWRSPMFLVPGTYKVRARKMGGWPVPPWTEDVFPVVPDIELLRTIQVPAA